MTLIFSIMSITALIFEIPTGAFADLFGRKKTMIIASFLSVIAITLLALSTNFYMLVIFAVIFAFKNTLNSGTEEAFFYDSLKKLGREKDYKKILGRMEVLVQVGSFIGAIAGGFMASYFLRLPFLLTIPITVFELILVFFLTEPSYKKEKHKDIFKHSYGSLRLFIKNRQLLLLTLFGVFSFGIGESLFHLNQIFFDFVDLPISQFGIAFALISILSMFGAFSSHFVSEKIGDKQTLILSYLLKGLMVITATIFLGYVGVFLLVLRDLFGGLSSPVMGNLLNREIESKNRSTVLSINNLMKNLGYIVFAPFIGYLADIYNISTAFRIAGILSVVFVIILFFIKNKDT
ncbi:MFS transporter [Candidatus Woesearchaeota archaeon]|nr:MFS transporter [Candidatus Woesearchaeota archaeon]